VNGTFRPESREFAYGKGVTWSLVPERLQQRRGALRLHGDHAGQLGNQARALQLQVAATGREQVAAADRADDDVRSVGRRAAISKEMVFIPSRM